jgi:hypothetical protein
MTMERQACAASGQIPESQWGLHGKTYMMHLVATLKLLGWIKFSFVYNKTVLTSIGPM